jgi:hypothetical protein
VHGATLQTRMTLAARRTAPTKRTGGVPAVADTPPWGNSLGQRIALRMAWGREPASALPLAAGTDTTAIATATATSAPRMPRFLKFMMMGSLPSSPNPTGSAYCWQPYGGKGPLYINQTFGIVRAMRGSRARKQSVRVGDANRGRPNPEGAAPGLVRTAEFSALTWLAASPTLSDRHSGHKAKKYSFRTVDTQRGQGAQRIAPGR